MFDDNLIFSIIQALNKELLKNGIFTLQAQKSPYWKLTCHEEKTGKSKLVLIALNNVEMAGKLSAMMLAFNLKNGIQ